MPHLFQIDEQDVPFTGAGTKYDWTKKCKALRRNLVDVYTKKAYAETAPLPPGWSTKKRAHQALPAPFVEAIPLSAPAADAERTKAAADQIQSKLQQDATDAAEDEDIDAAAWRALQEQADADEQDDEEDEEDENDETAKETMTAKAQAEAVVHQPAPVAESIPLPAPAPVAVPVRVPVPVPVDMAPQPNQGAPANRKRQRPSSRKQPLSQAPADVVKRELTARNTMRHRLFSQMVPIITKLLSDRGITMHEYPPYIQPDRLPKNSDTAYKKRITDAQKKWRNNNEIHICTRAPRSIIDEAFHSLPDHRTYTSVMERYRNK